MDTTQKVFAGVLGIIFIGLCFFCVCWTVINWSKVEDTMNGTKIYNQEDMNSSYKDGYTEALENKAEYETLIDGYRDNITTLNDSVSQLQGQISVLTTNKTNLEREVVNLNTIKTNNEDTIANLSLSINGLELQIEDLEEEVANLTIIKTNNESAILGLTSEKVDLESQVRDLTASNQTKTNTINSLNSNIAELNNDIVVIQSTIQSLTAEKIANSITITNLNNEISRLEIELNEYILNEDNNLETITNLTTQIENLQLQVNNLTSVNQSNTAQINTLNLQIVDLNTEIDTLELQVNNLTSVNQSNTAQINTLNEQIVDLNIEIDTLELANITLTNDNRVYQQEIAVLNSSIDSLEDTIAIYEGNNNGLSSQILSLQSQIDTLNINISSLNNTVSMQSNTISNLTNTINSLNLQLSNYERMILELKGENSCLVQFFNENELHNAQIVNVGSFVSTNDPMPPSLMVFSGWSANNEDINNIVNLSNYSITQDTSFYANFTELPSFDYDLNAERIVHTSSFVNTSDFAGALFRNLDIVCIKLDLKIYGHATFYPYTYTNFKVYTDISFSVDNDFTFSFVSSIFKPFDVTVEIVFNSLPDGDFDIVINNNLASDREPKVIINQITCYYNHPDSGLFMPDVATFPTIDNQVYTGERVTPAVVFQRPADCYSIISYGPNISGVGKIYIRATAGWYGVKVLTFNIGTNVEDCSISDIPDQTYTGSAIRPELIITYNGLTLVSGTDYTIITYTSVINVGVATLTIKGINGYYGETTKTFNIVGAIE